MTPAMIPTPEEELEDRVVGMAHWLRMMLSPADPDAVLYHLWYERLGDALEVELGERAFDDLYSDSVCASAFSLTIHLEIRIEHGLRDRAVWVREQRRAAEQRLLARPGRAVWECPAFAPHVMPQAELAAVIAWMDDNDVDDASVLHPLTVTEHSDGARVVTYERGRRLRTLGAPNVTGETDTARAWVRTDPPALSPLPDLAEFGAVITDHSIATAHHNMPLPYGAQVCAQCTDAAAAGCPVVWPCPPAAAALAMVAAELVPA